MNGFLVGVLISALVFSGYLLIKKESDYGLITCDKIEEKEPVINGSCTENGVFKYCGNGY